MQVTDNDDVFVNEIILLSPQVEVAKVEVEWLYCGIVADDTSNSKPNKVVIGAELQRY